MHLQLNKVEFRFCKGDRDEVEVEEEGNDDDEEGGNSNKGEDSSEGDPEGPKHSVHGCTMGTNRLDLCTCRMSNLESSSVSATEDLCRSSSRSSHL
jgi:hypothetical protein